MDEVEEMEELEENGDNDGEKDGVNGTGIVDPLTYLV